MGRLVTVRLQIRLVIVSIAVILSAALFLVVPAGAGQAEVYNCDTSGNYFDGYQQPYLTGTAEGAAANIVNRYGAVCDTDTSMSNFVAAWAMIANGDKVGWVQSGYMRWYNHSSVFFSQVCQHFTGQYCAGQFTTVFGTESLTYGNTNFYDEIWNTSCSCEHSKIDGNVEIATTFNPFNAWTWPFAPEFYGEAVYKQNDMPGNSSSPTYFEDPQHQNTTSDDWVSYGCNTLSKYNDLAGYTRTDGESWYDVIASNCPNFKIYTDSAG